MTTNKAQIAFDEQREATRHNVSLRSVLIECSIFGEHVDIVNIARLGVLARTRLKRETGTEITLHLPELGAIPAQIVWCNNGLIGARFHDAIDENRFTDFLEAQRNEVAP